MGITASTGEGTYKNRMGLGNAITRDNGIPLDLSTLHATYNDAVVYAATSSIAGFRGLDLCPAYSASKAFELSYLESLRRKSKTERKIIKIISLIPGFVNTAMGQGAGVFWRCEPEVAAQQIRKGIEQKKEIIYITKRWRIVAWLMKRIPNFLFENIAFRTKA